MKMLPEPALAQLQGRRPIVAGSMKAVFGDGGEETTYRLWSGYGTIQIDAENYKGIGARALITRGESRIGGAADSLTITLSGLDPDVAQSIENEDYHQKPIIIRRVIFAPDRRTILGSAVFKRARVDIVQVREKVGGEAAIDFAIEGPRADMNRSGGRIAADADQRVLGGQNDASMKHVSVAGVKTLNWGNKPSNLGGSSSQGMNLIFIPGMGFVPVTSR